MVMLVASQQSIAVGAKRKLSCVVSRHPSHLSIKQKENTHGNQSMLEKPTFKEEVLSGCYPLSCQVMPENIHTDSTLITEC